jgi:hypothetical protein
MVPEAQQELQDGADVLRDKDNGRFSHTREVTGHLSRQFNYCVNQKCLPIGVFSIFGRVRRTHQYRAHTHDARSHMMHDFPKSIHGILFTTTQPH